MSAGRLSVRGIVLLAKKPSRKERAVLLESGITLLQYLHGTAYFAEFARTKEKVRVPHLLVWAGKLKPEDKLENALWAQDYESWAVTKYGDIKILVTFRKEVSEREMRKLLKQFCTRYKRHNGFEVWRAEIGSDKIIELAGKESIEWIEQGPHPCMPLR